MLSEARWDKPRLVVSCPPGGNLWLGPNSHTHDRTTWCVYAHSMWKTVKCSVRQSHWNTLISKII